MKNNLPDLLMTVAVPLECGCVLTQTIREPASFKSDAKYAGKFLEYASRLLNLWYQTHRAEHKCELVTPKNPTGSKRLAKKV